MIIPPVLQPGLYYGNASRAAGASTASGSAEEAFIAYLEDPFSSTKRNKQRMQRAAPAYGEAPPDPAQSEKERLDRLEKERLQREKEEEERQARELLEKQRAELAKRMEKAGAKQGAMNVSLMWTNDSGKGCDLDLYVETPKGRISYSNKAMGNGKLDVDRRASAGDMMENVFWTKPDVGKYHVYVRNCTHSSLKSSGGTMPFTVILKTDNSISLLDAEGKTTVPDFVGVKAFDHEFIGGMENISACYFEVKEGSIKT